MDQADNKGNVTSVRVSVVDACFPHRLPELGSQLRARENGEVVIEVGARLSIDTVRGIQGAFFCAWPRRSRVFTGSWTATPCVWVLLYCSSSR